MLHPKSDPPRKDKYSFRLLELVDAPQQDSGRSKIQKGLG